MVKELQGDRVQPMAANKNREAMGGNSLGRRGFGDARPHESVLDACQLFPARSPRPSPRALVSPDAAPKVVLPVLEESESPNIRGIKELRNLEKRLMSMDRCLEQKLKERWQESLNLGRMEQAVSPGSRMNLESEQTHRQRR